MLETYRNLNKAFKNSEHVKTKSLARWMSVFIEKFIAGTTVIPRAELFEAIAAKNDGASGTTALLGDFKRLTNDFGIVTQSSNNKRIFHVSTDNDYLVDLFNRVSEEISNQNNQEKLNLPSYHHKSTLRPRTSTRGIEAKRTIQLSGNNRSMMSILMSILPDSDVNFSQGTLCMDVEDESTGEVTTKEVLYQITTKTAQEGSERSIMQQEDIQVYLATSSLTYFSVVHDKNTHDYGGDYQVENNLHAHLDDIVRVVYPDTKTVSSRQRTYVREALERIRTTSVDFYGIDDIYNVKDISKYNKALLSVDSNVNLEKARLVEFRPFEKFGREELIYRKNGSINVIDSTVDYTISLNREVFKTLKERDYHFLIPPSLLGKHTLLYHLYMQFRYKFNKQSDEFKINFDDAFFPHGVPANSRSERDELIKGEVSKLRKKINSIQSAKKQAFLSANVVTRYHHKLELYGYHCDIDYKAQVFNVRMNKDELLKAANTAPRRNTPTISNELRDAKFFDHTLEDQGVNNPLRRLNNVLNVVKFNYLTIFEIDSEFVGMVSPLNRPQDDVALVQNIAAKTDVDEQTIEKYIDQYKTEGVDHLGSFYTNDDFKTGYLSWCYEQGRNFEDSQSRIDYYQYIELIEENYQVNKQK
ncbi:replication initiator protein RctB domain-containing protein [Vibrio sp. THAF190c]|uniref:replication initiator protein RctB domain-containing protein n=1 Tax=Vibrio sp. THAF190c TaxID=2587865 RepID=UPI001562A02D|nr:replication initiator protein RctB domain-containing protein [Vibrio sp. THAF190c]